MAITTASIYEKAGAILQNVTEVNNDRDTLEETLNPCQLGLELYDGEDVYNPRVVFRGYSEESGTPDGYWRMARLDELQELEARINGLGDLGDLNDRYAQLGHHHYITEVTDLEQALGARALINHTHPYTDIRDMVPGTLLGCRPGAGPWGYEGRAEHISIGEGLELAFTGNPGGGTYRLRVAADSSGPNSIAWGDITGKPSTFPPDAHNHTQYVQKSGDTMTGVLRMQTGGAYSGGDIWFGNSSARIYRDTDNPDNLNIIVNDAVKLPYPTVLETTPGILLGDGVARIGDINGFLTKKNVPGVVIMSHQVATRNTVDNGLNMSETRMHSIDGLYFAKWTIGGGLGSAVRIRRDSGTARLYVEKVVSFSDPNGDGPGAILPNSWQPMRWDDASGSFY